MSKEQTMTWTVFKEWVRQFVESGSRKYFRGHADADNWKLETSFHREAKTNKITLVEYLDGILPQVHYYISAFQDKIIDTFNPNEFGAFLAL